MATTTSVTTTYAGEFLKEYISAAIFSGRTLSANAITVKPNVKYKAGVKNLSTETNVLDDATCDFTATGTVTLTERILEPKSLQLNKTLCKSDFRSDWEAIEMGLSAHDNLPPSFADYLMSHYVAKVAQQMEINIWRGATGNAGEFDGFAVLVAADAALPTAQEVAGTTVTAANVIVELRKIVDVIPSRLYGAEDLFIYVSQNIYRAYVAALGGYGASGLGANGIDGKGPMWGGAGLTDLMIDGVKIFMTNGLNDNTAIATTKGNLWFGTGVMNDTNEVKLIDTADILGDQNVRVVMRMTGGCQYGNITDIVTYGITNSAN
jgi:hypothetical protein